MIKFPGGGGICAPIVAVACIILQLADPGRLRAQQLPQVYYICEFSLGRLQQMGPDSSYDCHFYYGHTAANPLVVESVRQVETYSGPEGTSTSDTTFAFAGSFEQYSDHFICRSPGGTTYLSGHLTPVYRTSKISNDGYYLEDDYSYELDNQNPFFQVRYFYTDGMKLLRTVYSRAGGPWDKVECEVDSLGRRMQDIWYRSPDSLSWAPRYRQRYYYTGAPASFGTGFEKYTSYPSAYYLHPGADALPMYVNDDWELGSIGFSGWDNGDWSAESVANYTLQLSDTGYYAYIYASYWSWNLNGLPVSLNLPNGYDAMGYSLAYGHTSQTDVDDGLLNPPVRLSVWPNPSPGLSRLKLNIGCATDVSVSTYNLRGQLVKREGFRYSPNAAADYCWKACDSGGAILSSGVYLIKADWEGGSGTARIVVYK